LASFVLNTSGKNYVFPYVLTKCIPFFVKAHLIMNFDITIKYMFSCCPMLIFQVEWFISLPEWSDPPLLAFYFESGMLQSSHTSFATWNSRTKLAMLVFHPNFCIVIQCGESDRYLLSYEYLEQEPALKIFKLNTD
jgi:hypothetical protein